MVLALIIVPSVCLVAWWGYHREKDVPLRARLVLAGLRAGALIAFLLLLFAPYVELSRMRTVRSHLVVLLDSSDSMSTSDTYEPADATKLAKAAGTRVSELDGRTRFDLARDVLGNSESGLLERFAEKYRVHVMTFGAQVTPVASTGDTADDDAPDAVPPSDRLRLRIAELRSGESSTRLGQSVASVLDTFRLRDEPVAGVVVLSDGQSNAGTPTPLAAGRRASSQDVPVFAVGVGDPRSPKNVHVSNLRAKEVVLARDTAVFEFDVSARGFEGRPAEVEMRRLDDNGQPAGSPMPLRPASIQLEGGDGAQHVRVVHTFLRAGTYSLRIGVPPQEEERITSDNWVTHTMRVIDRKIQVLYVEAPPRYDYIYLSNALTRDHDTIRAHTLLMDADNDTPQPATRAPGWKPLDLRDGFPKREKLFEYDVVILGDVDPDDLGRRRDESREVLANLHEFVETGGGLILIAGARDNPSSYKGTELEPLLPIVVDRTAESLDPQVDPRSGFPLRITQQGERSPLVNVAGDMERSKALWETSRYWQQFWVYPSLRAKSLAQVLAVSGHPEHENKFGKRPAIATMKYGRGRVLFVGVDDLWRTRKGVGDLYFYRFYGEAVRLLATYKLLGGNRRFKILTDRDQYVLDDTVRVTLDVLDSDYKPSTEPNHTVRLEMPGDQPGDRETVDIEIPAVGKEEPGTFRKTITPTRSGQYLLYRDADAPGEEPAKKLFQVVRSTLEDRDLLLDEATLGGMARESSGGRYLNLWDLPELDPPARSQPVPTDVRPDELWDNWWALVLAISLLAAEWLLRKRFQMV